MKEELGIAAEPEDLRLVGVHDGRYEGEFHGRIFKNHEKSHVFAYEKPVEIEKLKLQKEEVESVVSKSGRPAIESYVTGNDWKNAKLIELLYCVQGCHRGDGVR